MDARPATLRKRWSWLPLAVLLPFAFTLLGWKQSAEQAKRDISEELHRNVSGVTQALQLQLREYQYLLEGARGLVASSITPQGPEWRAYLQQVNSKERFPGVQAIGYAMHMSQSEAEKHWQTLDPSVPRMQFVEEGRGYVIVANQRYGPTRPIPQKIVTQDDPTRMAALTQARITGQATISQPLHLLNDPSGNAADGLFMVLPWHGPAYAASALPKKGDMEGILYATWHAEPFMKQVADRYGNDLAFKVEDAITGLPLYQHVAWSRVVDEHGKCRGLSEVRQIPVYGRTWRVEGCDTRMLSSMPSYVQAHRWLAMGTLASFFLLGFGYWILRQRAEALAQSERHQKKHLSLSHRLREIATRVPVLIAHLDHDGRYLFANELYLHWFGIDPYTIEGKRPEEVFGEKMGGMLSQNVARALAGETFRQEVMNEGRVFDVHYTPETQPDGTVTGAYVVASDISKHKQMERILSEEKERAEVTLTSIGEAVVSFDQQGLVLYNNPAAQVLLQPDYVSLPGQSGQEALRFYSENGFELEPHPLDELLESGTQQVLSNILIGNANGEMVPAEATFSAMKDKEGRIMGAVAVIRDVSRAMEMSRNLRHMAHHDALTGLANRMEIHARIDELLTTPNQQGVLVFLDLDHFKNINDTLGHEVGDLVLLEVASRIRSVVGPAGLVARQGGDEFLILLPGSILPHAEKMARKLLDDLMLPFDVQGRHLRIAASAGLAAFPQAGMDRIELMRRADAAMYAAKRSGRNQIASFEPAMSHYAEERMLIEQGLRNALSGEGLTVAYQPKIDAHSKTMAGYEALVRWHHEGGLRGPAYFIPIAEECGLVGKIDTWILRQACRQQAQWLSQGLSPMPCSVNVSMAWLDGATLLNCVDEALAETKIPPHLLQIEFTETQVMHDGNQARHLIHALRERGVSVALDDFGTGYSNLGSLNSFGFDTVKIDRSFIQELGDPKRLSLVRAIISIGRAHGHTIVAEGVETEAQASILAREGCHQMQGFLYSKPVDASAIQQWLTHPFSH